MAESGQRFLSIAGARSSVFSPHWAMMRGNAGASPGRIPLKASISNDNPEKGTNYSSRKHETMKSRKKNNLAIIGI